MRLIFFSLLYLGMYGCVQREKSVHSINTKLILIDENHYNMELRGRGEDLIPDFYFQLKGFGNDNVYVSYIHGYYDDIKSIDKISLQDYQLIEIDTVSFETWFYWDDSIPTYLALKKDYLDYISNEQIEKLTIFEISIHASSIE